MTREQAARILNEGALPGHGEAADLLETHISWVLLSGPYAIKIKRPVRYSFLDFSSREKRSFFLGEELRLNRRLAPDMYLDTLPVWSLPDGKLRIDEQPPSGADELDRCLLMKRQDGQFQMDRLLRSGEVDTERIRQLARILASFHRRTEKLYPGDQAEREFDRYRDLEATLPRLEGLLSPTTFQLLAESVLYAGQLLDSLAERLNEREANGWFIDGHGDLHSGNIFLLDPPVIFDCIEFDPKLRQLDILNELGFFLMDLDFHGQSRLGDLFLEQYLGEYPVIEQAADRKLLSYFKMYRANVRLKVNALRWDPDQPESALAGSIRQYAKLLLGYFAQLKASL